MNRALKKGGLLRTNYNSDGNCSNFFKVIRKAMEMEVFLHILMIFPSPGICPQLMNIPNWSMNDIIFERLAGQFEMDIPEKKEYLNDNNISSSSTNALTKIKFEHCKAMWEENIERLKIIESKARAHSTLIFIFLGAIFFKIDKYSELIAIIEGQKLFATYIFYTPLIILFFCLFCSLMIIIYFSRIRKWSGIIQDNTFNVIFMTDSEAQFYDILSKKYYIAFDHDNRMIQQNAKLILVSSYFIYISIIALFFFIVMLILSMVLQ